MRLSCSYSREYVCQLHYVWGADHGPQQGRGSFLPQSPQQTGKGRGFVCFCMLCILLEAFPYFLPFMNIHALAPGKHQKVYLFLDNIIVSSYSSSSCQKATSEERSPRPWIIRIWLSPHSHTLKDVLLHLILNHSSELLLRGKYSGWERLKAYEELQRKRTHSLIYAYTHWLFLFLYLKHIG